jgi:hypothetical protein
MKSSHLILFVLALFSLSQCKKDDEAPQLPPETTTGANQAGCRINGQVLIPRSKGRTEGLTFAFINRGNGRTPSFFLAFVDAQASPFRSVVLEMDSLVLREGQTYPFRTPGGRRQASHFDGKQDYIKRDQDQGELTITRLDSTQRILSGRFHFVGTDKNSGQQVQVTDGRFDLRYSQ